MLANFGALAVSEVSPPAPLPSQRAADVDSEIRLLLAVQRQDLAAAKFSYEAIQVRLPGFFYCWTFHFPTLYAHRQFFVVEAPFSFEYFISYTDGHTARLSRCNAPPLVVEKG